MLHLAAQLSFDIPVGDVPSAVNHPRVIGTLARDLFVQSVDGAVHERYVNGPQAPPAPGLYQPSVQEPGRQGA